MHKLIVLAFIVAPLCRAFQFPFDISSVWSTKHKLPLSPDVVPLTPRSPRIAIIGAGAGGSSAAFWISKAKERYGIDVAIDIYERSDYVGGRSTTVHPYNNNTAYEPIELGASIFVEVNKNLWRAANEFDLPLMDPEFGSQAIWDGEQIQFSMWGSSSWFPIDQIKFLWRYGYRSPTRTQELVQAMTDKIVELYGPDTPYWSSIEELNDALNWTGPVSQTGAKLLQSHGISERYTYEFIEALSRCNYAQNVDSIHGLGALVSAAADGTVRSVKGGNWRIFEQFVERSGAQVFLNTEVAGIERHSKDIWTVVTKDEHHDYDAVVIAAPYHTSHISLPADLSSLIPPQPYIHLHVTLLTTNASSPNPDYFGYKPGSQVPTFVLTTFDGARRGGRAPEFKSLSYMGQTKFADNGTHDEQEADEWIVKIFSMERISDEWLATMFQNQVSWVLRKEWDSYPVLSPTTSFPPLKLDDGLFYVNAFEPLISTMETETIASRNVVDLLLREKFNSSICHLDEEKRGKEAPAGFVYGWDC